MSWRPRAIDRAQGTRAKKNRGPAQAARSSEIVGVTARRLPAIAAATTAAATTATTAAAAALAVVATATAAAAAVVSATAAAVAAATTTATTAAATVAAATAAIAAATAAEAATAAATAALLALLGFIHAKRPTVERATIHALDRLGGFLGGSHGHEGKAARAAGLTVRDQVDITDRSELLERCPDALRVGIER